MPFRPADNLPEFVPYVQNTTGATNWGIIGGPKDPSLPTQPNQQSVTPYFYTGTEVDPEWRVAEEAYAYTGDTWKQITTGFHEFEKSETRYARFDGLPQIGQTLVLSTADPVETHTFTAATAEDTSAKEFKANGTEAEAATSLLACINAQYTSSSALDTLNDGRGYIQFGKDDGDALLPITVTNSLDNVEVDSLPADGTTPYGDGWFKLPWGTDGTDTDPQYTPNCAGTGCTGNASRVVTVDNTPSGVTADSTVGEIRIVVVLKKVATHSFGHDYTGYMTTMSPPDDSAIYSVFPLFGHGGGGAPFVGMPGANGFKKKIVFDSRAESWGIASFHHWIYDINNGLDSPWRVNEIGNAGEYEAPCQFSYARGRSYSGFEFQENRISPIYAFSVFEEQLPGELQQNNYGAVVSDIARFQSDDGASGPLRSGLIGKKIHGTWFFQTWLLFSAGTTYTMKFLVYVKPA
jgi:hypothetical protein